MATQLDTRDQIDFDELVRHFDDETKCEVDHIATKTSCSGEVWGRYQPACRPEVRLLTCQTGVEYVKAAVARSGKCRCGAMVRDCWMVTPI